MAAQAEKDKEKPATGFFGRILGRVSFLLLIAASDCQPENCELLLTAIMHSCTIPQFCIFKANRTPSTTSEVRCSPLTRRMQAGR